MQLKKEDGKVYILITNAESIKDIEGYNCWDSLHGSSFISYASPYYLVTEGAHLHFHGDKDWAPVIIEKMHRVNRIIPHSITARSYWGEFRRRHPYSQRCHKLVHLEESVILECKLLQGECKSWEFNSFQEQGHLMDPNNPHKSVKRVKTWNLSLERNLGPNLNDYSINDCYKYYTLL